MTFLHPSWNAPQGVRSLQTTRTGGTSTGDFASLNLALHVGDDPELVRQNRRLVVSTQAWQHEPVWLNQVHGTLVIHAEGVGEGEIPTADGCITRRRGLPLVVQTADCLPVLACDRHSTVVGAFHVGWRGLADGILAKGIEAFGIPAEDLCYWVGPGIGAKDYQVGDEVWSVFVRHDDGHREDFAPDGPGHWHFDLSGAAARQLRSLGVGEVHQAPWESYRDKDLFFSHRRESPTGRCGSFIWLE
ncbi:MAG: peptidoglycan editing factor PgeF [Spirochaetales bacterium]